jgi:enediyne biosynthesis protein E3
MSQSEQMEKLQVNQMDPWLASLLSAREARGITVDPKANQRFIKVRRTIMGVNELIAEGQEPEVILAQLSQMEIELLGFALEGAGMALGEKDISSSDGFGKVETFLKNTSVQYQIMVLLGVGALLATDRKPILPYIQSYLNPFNPLRVWPIIDGYGFQYGMLHWRDFLSGQPRPESLSGYNGRVFDQGLGRSIWVIDAGQVDRIPQTIATFSPTRQPDMWCGVGYACASIGGIDRKLLEILGAAAGMYLSALTQGAVCAAAFRRSLGTLAPQAEFACEVFSKMISEVATESNSKISEHMKSIGSTPTDKLWQPYRSYLIYDRVG